MDECRVVRVGSVREVLYDDRMIGMDSEWFWSHSVPKGLNWRLFLACIELQPVQEISLECTWKGRMAL